MAPLRGAGAGQDVPGASVESRPREQAQVAPLRRFPAGFLVPGVPQLARRAQEVQPAEARDGRAHGRSSRKAALHAAEELIGGGVGGDGLGDRGAVAPNSSPGPGYGGKEEELVVCRELRHVGYDVDGGFQWVICHFVFGSGMRLS